MVKKKSSNVADLFGSNKNECNSDSDSDSVQEIQKRQRKPPTTKLSFNTSVIVVKYQKTTPLSPKKTETEHTGLKVAKKGFLKRITTKNTSSLKKNNEQMSK